jgi:hypothetical protein
MPISSTRLFVIAALTAALAVPIGAAVAGPADSGSQTKASTPDSRDDAREPKSATPAATPSAAPNPKAPPKVFTHPGVLVSRKQLDLVKAKVATNAQPWKTAYETMRKSRFASLSYQAKPRETVECGSRSNPNHGCSDERDDGIAAYTHALQWYITGDIRYARKAIEIMDAWSPVIKRHTNSNAPLQTGWAGANWSRAAEIIAHTGAGWPAAGVNRFKTMLRDVYLPGVLQRRPNTNGNWELIMTDAAIGIAVFLDDRAAFDRAVQTWRQRVPAYMYVKSDGPLPRAPGGSRKDSRAELVKYWHRQERFETGLAQETCRDFGHTGWGLDAAAHAAETARHQGVDLYQEARERFVGSMEFHAAYELGKAVPPWLCGGRLTKGLGHTPEVIYNHFHNRSGVDLPQTKQLIETRSRPTGAGHFIAWETLTHAQNP